LTISHSTLPAKTVKMSSPDDNSPPHCQPIAIGWNFPHPLREVGKHNTNMPLTDPSHDLALLNAIRGTGDAATNAFGALYQRHQAPLYRYALLRSGRADVAADVVQDVFMSLMTNSLKFDATRGALQPFLFGVARNLLLKRDEAARRFVSTSHFADSNGDESAVDLIADDAATPEQRMLGNESAELVRRALAKIAPHYRDVLILYEIHELSYVEIAHVCGIDLGTVRSRLSRGRAKLAELLTPMPAHAAAITHTNNDKFQPDYDHG
jgi:RNA polymerase sigma-70 factor, ECF subfamily